ncbi:hypothetical protein J2X16_003684 [Pelomonas aquatica]|uniref:Uncharacterized protein n=1 Tax=Pelomonas aquatica TaxID=431058 RepID=A0ABU1ZE46_9BURK|nr:hypothetical protein [Pelomonas aquatica]
MVDGTDNKLRSSAVAAKAHIRKADVSCSQTM